ncbi:MAG: hypothetical protein KatS3mg068_1513 [Candidatus Sericytochromatia bacterium]|nr:MAG: hypothetical protein KatS3mg068_1513 [Candidatus Sericytochromatia bacterium]
MSLETKENFLGYFSFYNLNSNLEEVKEYVLKYKNFSFDFETAGFNDLSPITISFTIKSDDDKYYGFVVDLRELENFDILFEIFNISNLVICHNLYFDLLVLKQIGYDIYNLRYKTYDTMLAIYVSNTESKKGLKNYIEDSISYEESFNLENFDLQKFKIYNLQDSFYTFKLYESTFPTLKRKNNILAFYLEIQSAFISIYMTDYGVYVDKEELEVIMNEYKKEIENKEKLLKEIAKSKYNFDLDLNSRISITDFFKNYILIDIEDDEDLKTPKGDVSVSITAISSIDLDDEIKKKFVENYIEYKEIRKIYETYNTDSLLKNSYLSRVKPNIRSSGTKTARMIITNPPLQTIPSNDVGKRIRSVFKSRDENKFLVIDLSQLELRLLVHYLNKNELKDKYNSGEDLHDQTSKLLGVDRKHAKIINFMIVYGGGAKSVAKKLGITEELAKEYIDKFSSKLLGYSELKSFITDFVINNGYIRLPLNYYRCLEGDDYTKIRVGFNSLIQMTASIFMKMGMYLIFETFFEKSGLCLQVHDELIFENNNDILERVYRFLKIIYENMFIYKTDEYLLGQDLKFKIEGKIGNNWLDCKN